MIDHRAIRVETEVRTPHKERFSVALRKDFARNRYVYLLLLPVVIYYLLFQYKPMYGAIIAFKDYSPISGIIGSPWVGFEHFRRFFVSHYFGRVVRNTVLINLYQLVFAFPLPILFALLLNELRSDTFKRSVQTITYLPHFVSVVVIAGIIVDFLNTEGLVNDLLSSLGGRRIAFLQFPQYFRAVYVISGIWQELGWSTIIYLAALTTISDDLYEAAIIDGASRFRRVLHVTIPGIVPTVIVLLILQMGRLMNEGAEKVLLLYNPLTYETADIISTFVYRKGLLEMDFSFSTAVGLFNSIVNMTLLFIANYVSRTFTEMSLW